MDQTVQNNLFLLQRRAVVLAVGWESGYSRHEAGLKFCFRKMAGPRQGNYQETCPKSNKKVASGFAGLTLLQGGLC